MAIMFLKVQIITNNNVLVEYFIFILTFALYLEIFHNYKDKTRYLKPHSLEDTLGMLNLYEASYHSFEDESILDDVRDFTTEYLKENQEKLDECISSLVSHALELPLHHRVLRIEAKWFIEVYEKRSDMNPTLLELAKLDFNMVQAIHVEDLIHASRYHFNLMCIVLCANYLVTTYDTTYCILSI